MFPGHRRETSAAAFQLLALVEQYEQDTSALLCEAPPPAPLYARWLACFEEMRLIALTVPELHLAWLHVLISRAELVHSMWQASHGRRGALEDAAVPHQDAVTALRNRAMRLIRSENARILS